MRIIIQIGDEYGNTHHHIIIIITIIRIVIIIIIIIYTIQYNFIVQVGKFVWQQIRTSQT